MTNNLNVAEWIIVGILSFTLFVFLIVGIVALVKVIRLTKEAGKVVETGQSVANKANDIAGNVKDMTAVGPLAKGYVREYIGKKLFGKDEKKAYKNIEKRLTNLEKDK
ncbi:hypothetical protein IJF91_01705 [Candidatus Saccharibacteria bacterium]|nr:hypothetical protein [Candidatus Saccharibacteria bacterium]